MISDELCKDLVFSKLFLLVSSTLSMAQRRITKLIHHLSHSEQCDDTEISMKHTSSSLSETYSLSPPSKRSNLRGKTIFITGGSRGIGLAIALRCAQDSCNIVIAAKTAEPHPKLPGTIYTAAAQIESINASKCLPVVCDIRDEKLVKAAVQKAVDRFGGIDILINNASAISITNTLETSMKKYDLMHDVNARGTFIVTKYCLPHLIKSNKNAHVLTMSPPINMLRSDMLSNKVAYMTAKMGMSLATLGWSEEFKKYDIGVNSLWPRTAIATAAVNNILGGAEMMRRSRTPQIHADAAYLILTQPNNVFNGNFVWDEDILKQDGVTDFSKYRFDKTVQEKDIIRISFDNKWEMPSK